MLFQQESIAAIVLDTVEESHKDAHSILIFDPDPLAGDKDDPSAVVLALGRGPGFTEVAARLFEAGCWQRKGNRSFLLKQLINQGTSDHAVSMNETITYLSYSSSLL